MRRTAAVVLVTLHESWHDHAACKGMSVDMFFPVRGPFHGGESHKYRKAARRALSVCEGCIVRLDCLSAARREESVDYLIDGIRGGKTPYERWAEAVRVMA